MGLARRPLLKATKTLVNRAYGFSFHAHRPIPERRRPGVSTAVGTRSRAKEDSGMQVG